MPSTVKNLTLIGLILEGVSVIFLMAGLILLNQPAIISVLETEFPEEMAFFDLIRVLLIILAVIATLFFILNAYLFIPIIKGEKTKNTESKLLYQAIYGGINLTFNQLVGIIYLISGILGYNQIEKEKNPVREGI
jgi:hypothetical protein